MGRGRLGGAKRIMPPSPSTRIYRPAHLRHGLAGCAAASRRRGRAATLLDTGRPPPTAHPIRPRRIAFGRNAAGQTARAGGWGYVFGDEGGGVDIVRQAVRAALRMEENWGPPTSLRQALLDATGQASANRVLHLFYTPDWPRSRAAALASLVDSAAAEGDPVALHILETRQRASFAREGRLPIGLQVVNLPHSKWPNSCAPQDTLRGCVLDVTWSASLL